MSDEKGADSKLCVESKGIYSDEKPCRSEGKDNDYDDEAKGEYLDDGKLKTDFECPQVDVTALTIEPVRGPLDGPLELALSFTLDRDVVAGYWQVLLLYQYCLVCDVVDHVHIVITVVSLTHFIF